MKFKWTVFLVALVFSLVIGALSNISLYLDRTFNLTTETAFWVFFVINVVSFFISPLLLFASFYLIGRNIDIIAEFQSVLMPLFFGNWAGHLIGYFSLTLWYISLYAGPYFGPYVFTQFIWIGVSKALSLEFFAGLSALSIAYVVKKR